MFLMFLPFPIAEADSLTCPVCGNVVYRWGRESNDYHAKLVKLGEGYKLRKVHLKDGSLSGEKKCTRIKYGKEKQYKNNKLQKCNICGAKLGEYHSLGCKNEECPIYHKIDCKRHAICDYI
ncbi:hypothetical protein [Clostridium ljungdahlii]|uniref:Uncharacterized protein n=1 Tax=Clostridium ljungdahlii TaxID=1538 RepID=A0A168MKR1_9CLOT|nr:hypothetical protein [Clostridium ljungdahlii]OAA84825.1 hypothetical protein WY13_02728 [Clostridium ljungdahlii]